jgi:zeaxanthin epoxidase
LTTHLSTSLIISQPNLGQGGCQAIEDAFVLSEQLAATKNTKDLPDSLQKFYRERIVRVSVVQFLSRLASDLIINAFDTPWSPHDNLGKSWKSYLTFFWKVCQVYVVAIRLVPFLLRSHGLLLLHATQPVLQYMIFPLQFAYLYSFYPSGSIGEIAAELEQKWRIQHQDDAEDAFALVKEEGQKIAGPSFFKKAEIPATVLAAKKD